MLTRLLVAINVIVYLWERFTGALSSDASLADHGALVGQLVLDGQWWRIFTSAFLHGSDMHILFNMFALWQVGGFVETVYGAPRMAAMYVLAALGSGLAVTFLTPDVPTVGASGAISGLFGALVAAGLRAGKAGQALVRQSVGVVVVNLLIGFTVPNISNEGHIGGLIVGFLAGFVLFTPRRIAVRVQVPAQPAAAGVPYAVRIDPRSDPHALTIEHPPDEPRAQVQEPPR